jgi:hypothetical protein
MSTYFFIAQSVVDKFSKKITFSANNVATFNV